MKGQGVTSDPSLILFVGGLGDSPVEQVVRSAHRAIALDTIEKAKSCDLFREIIVITDSDVLLQHLPTGVQAEVHHGPFHFGRSLRDVIRRYKIDRPLYIGGGSAPLLSSGDLAAIARQLADSENLVITNNLYSADLAGFSPGSAIESIELPALDNPLAQLLHFRAGLSQVSLPRTAATQFDVDTPTDLLVLKLCPYLGANTAGCLDAIELDTTRLDRAMDLFNDHRAEVIVAGRVGSPMWSYLEKETVCRMRVFSEERGMRAEGREARGEVRSCLGFYLQEVGTKRFFEALGEMGNAAFIDSRVIFNHFRLGLSNSDRFYSDLGQPEKIENPFARDFTEAALSAPIPVVLGGHSLVAGGLYALIDFALRNRESDPQPLEQ